jgi:hypothetical protein
MEQFADDQQIVKTLSVDHRECSKRPVCTDNLNAGVAVMKSAQDRA